ncbi:Protein CBG26229 [Caenorhabditis briggsae]|uniref:Uncharacterized protein n=2 Tax=Caenorhabditis briggsae TaxID=6238 RepID=A0AAE9ELG3_CAEBR|nr:Protein CBG26229 [Caenorhabditis briggsae]ULT93236.1 hypothetical protein L3Y34_003017 [Caenorhabditis briggsae]UMM26505.1 hypothetical protein L5515_010175 [Caenorhabditis briggsae]CAR99864.1 Protein CBG26229 [Caenorhabditis briggsae]
MTPPESRKNEENSAEKKNSLVILPRGSFLSRPPPDEQSPPTNRSNRLHRPIEIRSKRNPLILEENEEDQRKRRAEKTRPSCARELFGELSVQFRRPREPSESDSEDVKNSEDEDSEDKENDPNSMIPMEIGEENGLRDLLDTMSVSDYEEDSGEDVLRNQRKRRLTDDDNGNSKKRK